MLISKQEYFKRVSDLNDTDVLRDYLESDNIDPDVVIKLHSNINSIEPLHYVIPHGK